MDHAHSVATPLFQIINIVFYLILTIFISWNFLTPDIAVLGTGEQQPAVTGQVHAGDPAIVSRDLELKSSSSS